MVKQTGTVMFPAWELPVIADQDVLVIGGGPAGIMAAVASAGCTWAWMGAARIP
jgi:heterodisulfide reductase subunit A-like polyferredoxin